MGSSTRPQTVSDKHGWTSKTLNLIEKITQKKHSLLEALRKEKYEDDHAWGERLCDIVEQYHKGRIFVKSSSPGKGTTFRLELKK